MSVSIASIVIRPAVAQSEKLPTKIELSRIFKGDPGSITPEFVALAEQVHADKVAADATLLSVQQSAQVASEQATLATQKAVATAADRDAVALLAGQVQTDKSATGTALQSAEQAAQVAADQATLATQKAEATASDRDAVALLAGQVQTDKSATGTALQSAQQAAQVASDQATLATQKAVATAADRDAVTQTASQVALNKAATDTNLAASQLALQTTQTQTAVAGTSSVTAVSARDQAVAARDLSVAAWAASMSPAETLPAISKLMHSGAIVKALIYDTSKDSDGGQWRKRCQGKSWYTEAINGLWLGQAATAAAAWALSGSVTGAYFQNTTDGKFYALGAASPAVTETLRGNAREFPEQVAIVVESGRIVIYDLTQPTAPMWMVFSWAFGGAFTSVAALNGVMHVGCANGLIHYQFFLDTTEFRQTGNFRALPGLTPGNRSGSGALAAVAGSAYIVAIPVNDVSATIVDGAPVNPATGLAVPTVAVATIGGISVIKDNGTVVNSADTNALKSVIICTDGTLVGAQTGNGDLKISRSIRTLGASFASVTYNVSSNFALLSNTTANLAPAKDAIARGNVGGITLIKENPATPLNGMVAYLSSVFNSGWMVGDIRGAWLCDTAAELSSGVDRSVKNNTLTAVGTVTRSSVATGAALQKYSGFTAGINYLRQPYSANLDYGTGDFYYAFWMDSTSAGCKFSRGSGVVAGSFEVIHSGSGGALNFRQWTGSAMSTVASATIPAGIGMCIVQRVGTSVQVWWNGALIQSGTSANTMSCASSEFHVGNLQSGSQGDGGWTALLRTGAGSISADQIAKMYADELPLFQPGAQCTIDGASSGVTSLAYDDVADLLHIGTAWGRSSFRGLLRVDSEATTVGSVTSVSGNQGARLIAGPTGCRIWQPAMLLRDELRREEAARRALGQRPQFFEFDAVAAQTAFVIPKGYAVKAVYSAGVLQREGSTKSYTRAFDGFSETINFAVAPGAAVWVSIMCIRSA